MATRLPSALPRRPTATAVAAAPTSLLSLSSSALPLPPPPSHTPLSRTPSRAASIIRRPRRPYTFTQLVVQTDGSTYTHRTTAPAALYRSAKDTLNHVLWQPSNRTLRNVEVDEAGKLAAFRGRFGRGWDAEKTAAAGDDDAAVTASQMERLEAAAAADEGQDVADGAAGAGAGGKKTSGAGKKEAAHPRMDALSDLISSYGAQQEPRQELKPKPAKKK
ncbi:hypothetical protein Hte_005953 [Hypoxylon texense]